MYVLEVENLIRNYQKAVGKKGKEDIKVLKGLNFQVEEGDFTGIMGKSGCGKTTLLKVLGMIDKQTDGRSDSWDRTQKDFPEIRWRISEERNSDLSFRTIT